MAAWSEAVGVTQDFEVSAEELVRTLQRRGIPLASEIGAFVVLVGRGLWLASRLCGAFLLSGPAEFPRDSGRLQ